MTLLLRSLLLGLSVALAVLFIYDTNLLYAFAYGFVCYILVAAVSLLYEFIKQDVSHDHKGSDDNEE